MLIIHEEASAGVRNFRDIVYLMAMDVIRRSREQIFVISKLTRNND